MSACPWEGADDLPTAQLLTTAGWGPELVARCRAEYMALLAEQNESTSLERAESTRPPFGRCVSLSCVRKNTVRAHAPKVWGAHRGAGMRTSKLRAREVAIDQMGRYVWHAPQKWCGAVCGPPTPQAL